MPDLLLHAETTWDLVTSFPYRFTDTIQLDFINRGILKTFLNVDTTRSF